MRRWIVCRPWILVVLSLLCVAQENARIPTEARHKARYVNPVAKPADFTSAMFWGIAIADTRVAGYEQARIEIATSQFTCRVGGKGVVLNEDSGEVRGGLYRRHPWFESDAHDPMPLRYSQHERVVILRVGTRPDKVWHFWAASPRAMIPPGRLHGCRVVVRAKISRGALLQVGFDYWRNPVLGYESGGNNQEAGASDWYLPSDRWQNAQFSDIPRRLPEEP